LYTPKATSQCLEKETPQKAKAIHSLTTTRSNKQSILLKQATNANYQSIQSIYSSAPCSNAAHVLFVAIPNQNQMFHTSVEIGAPGAYYAAPGAPSSLI
jgi:hypothetical protein